jgi:hypothetical protein
MSINTFWEVPILGWSFDDFQSFRTNIFTPTTFDEKLVEYKEDYNRQEIGKVIFDLPITFNLGGKEDKVRLKTTDRPLGVFDFSLASKGLYKVIEYFSQELADNKPTIFKELNLSAGIVPPNFVASTKINGKSFFTFTDIDGITYNLTQQQKGIADIEQGVKGAKKQFATTTKKVYLKFNRQGGKVKYIEIYSLFYYSRNGGNVDYALCHLPALQVAEYFESRGIGVRFYMTRFVEIEQINTTKIRPNDIRTNQNLPLYADMLKIGGQRKSKIVFFQPIQVKDFYQEIDFADVFMLCQKEDTSFYKDIAEVALNNEIIDGDKIYPFGNPDKTQIQYFEAFERYRNKYAIYTKEGIFKSKEVIPQGQMFFHSMSIKNYLSDFQYLLQDQNRISTNASSNKYVRETFYKLLSTNFVGQKFYEFWMKICGFRLKQIILLQITQNLRKDLQLCINESKEQIDTMVLFLRNEIKKGNATATILLSDYLYQILRLESYPVSPNNEINYKGYIVNILQDSQIYAEGGYFPTPLDEIEKRDAKAIDILNELANL